MCDVHVKWKTHQSISKWQIMIYTSKYLVPYRRNKQGKIISHFNYDDKDNYDDKELHLGI